MYFSMLSRDGRSASLNEVLPYTSAEPNQNHKYPTWFRWNFAKIILVTRGLSHQSKMGTNVYKMNMVF